MGSYQLIFCIKLFYNVKKKNKIIEKKPVNLEVLSIKILLTKYFANFIFLFRSPWFERTLWFDELESYFDE